MISTTLQEDPRPFQDVLRPPHEKGVKKLPDYQEVVEELPCCLRELPTGIPQANEIRLKRMIMMMGDSACDVGMNDGDDGNAYGCFCRISMPFKFRASCLFCPIASHNYSNIYAS